MPALSNASGTSPSSTPLMKAANAWLYTGDSVFQTKSILAATLPALASPPCHQTQLSTHNQLNIHTCDLRTTKGDRLRFRPCVTHFPFRAPATRPGRVNTQPS